MTTVSNIPARIREQLRGAPAVTGALQAGRALIHFGPWRHVARAIVRRNRPPLRGDNSRALIPLHLDTAALVKTLRADGMAAAGRLPPAVLSRIRAVTDDLPPGEYGDFHEHSDIDALVRGAEVLDVVRGYIGAEPELLECTLVVHHAEDPAGRPIHSQRHFHFDFAGWQSLNLFVYLTDVGQESEAHQVVVGTHRNRPVRDAIRPWVPDDEIMTRFTERVRTITGPAGTMFFEDTEAFHRRLIMARRRVMLNVLYASHRSWLSQGRLTPKYLDYVRAHPELAAHDQRASQDSRAGS